MCEVTLFNILSYNRRNLLLFISGEVTVLDAGCRKKVNKAEPTLD